MRYKIKEDHVPDNSCTNVVLAAFVTSHARLKLYSYLERLGERVCYFDTDSVIYATSPDDTYHPEMGDYLGQ